MKKTLVLGLFVLAVLGIAVALNAAPPRKAKAPVLTAVTVAMQGMSSAAYVEKLQTELTKVAGASNVKVTFTPPQVTANLDEAKISAGAFVAAVGARLAKFEPARATGAGLAAYVGSAMCPPDKKMCGDCFTEIPKAVKGVKGVKDVTLDESGRVAVITFDKDAKVTTAQISKALTSSAMKFTVQFVAPDSEKKESKPPAGGACCPH